MHHGLPVKCMCVNITVKLQRLDLLDRTRLVRWQPFSADMTWKTAWCFLEFNLMIIYASLTLEINALVILSFFILVFIFIIDICIFSYVVPSFWSFHLFITNSSDCIVLVFFCLFYDVFRWCIEMCWSVFNSFAHSTVATPCLTKWISLLTSNLVLSELEWAGHCRAGGGREVRWAGW